MSGRVEPRGCGRGGPQLRRTGALALVAGLWVEPVVAQAEPEGDGFLRVRDGRFEIDGRRDGEAGHAGRPRAEQLLPVVGRLPQCVAWATGEARPADPVAVWRVGDPFTGDPPHERQGWYPIYDDDTSTLELIREYAARMAALGGSERAEEH